MIAMTLSVLFTIVAIATVLSLIDSWIRGRSEFAALSHERALLNAGFVPEVEPREVRLRRSRPVTLASVSRRSARRTPSLAVQLSA